MKKLTFKGRAYSGMDPETKEFFEAKTGDTVSVSDKKAEQLLADFPKDWTAVEETPAKKLEADQSFSPAPVRAKKPIKKSAKK